MSEFIKVAELPDIQDGRAKKVVIKGQELALYNVEGKVFATTNICPHQGGPLDEGELDGNTIVCPWHGWMFDICTGQLAMNPSIKTRTYQVKVENNDVLVSL